MASVAPGVAVVDLTHQVPAFDVLAGAETLRHATRYMPPDTVYLAVVDPGVGTERRALAIGTGSGAFLVGPDNGLLLPAAEALGGVRGAVRLTDGRYHVHPVSNTFHGRDVFAPVAAHLAAGVRLEALGEAVEPASLEQPALREARRDRPGELTAGIISVDRFGNARLSVMQDEAGLEYGSELAVDAGDGDMQVRYVETFGSARAGELILVPDSHWRLSLSINKGNAARALALEVGGLVHLKLPENSPGTPS